MELAPDDLEWMLWNARVFSQISLAAKQAYVIAPFGQYRRLAPVLKKDFDIDILPKGYEIALPLLEEDSAKQGIMHINYHAALNTYYPKHDLDFQHAWVRNDQRKAKKVVQSIHQDAHLPILPQLINDSFEILTDNLYTQVSSDNPSRRTEGEPERYRAIRREIEKHYGLVVEIKDEAVTSFQTFVSKACTDMKSQLKGLNDINESLARSFIRMRLETNHYSPTPERISYALFHWKEDNVTSGDNITPITELFPTGVVDGEYHTFASNDEVSELVDAGKIIYLKRTGSD